MSTTASSLALSAAQCNAMATWFENIRTRICAEFEAIEVEYAARNGGEPGVFTRKAWEREAGGGGTMAIMRGQVFEKVGVNVSVVHGDFAPEFRAQIPGTENSAQFWASGISLVAHMRSPHIPTVHMNTRLVTTGKYWFGGGMDLTPCLDNQEDYPLFHRPLEACCKRYDEEYYPRFKAECDRYFYLPHRNEMRGIGGIFYDYHNKGWEQDVAFTKDVGETFLAAFTPIVRPRMFAKWSEAQKMTQKIKRGRYVEFNLLHDRGTKFGFMTGGNTEAILMSMPPEAAWP